jgi:hypothetical protein
MFRQILASAARGDLKVALSCLSNRAIVVNVFLALTSLLHHARSYPAPTVDTPWHYALSGGPCISTGSA